MRLSDRTWYEYDSCAYVQCQRIEFIQRISLVGWITQVIINFLIFFFDFYILKKSLNPSLFHSYFFFLISLFLVASISFRVSIRALMFYQWQKTSLQIQPFTTQTFSNLVAIRMNNSFPWKQQQYPPSKFTNCRKTSQNLEKIL